MPPPSIPPQHPLDMFPLFRRWRPSLPRNLVYTGLWSSGIGLLVALAYPAFDHAHPAPAGGYLGPMLLYSNLIGYQIHLASLAGQRLLRGWPRRATGWRRMLYQLLLACACVVSGMTLGSALLRGASPLQYLLSRDALADILPSALLVALFMYWVRASGERRIARETLAARQNEQIAATARLLAEARLRALQAQIEPHFLYNTLANVLSLIGPDPGRAQHMLERFIDYLRASLSASRAQQSTLGAEADLARAYLDVMAVRMGARLRYRIDVPDDLRGVAIAPMLLQPLLENAIAHGLEPMVDGGDVVLEARLLDDGVLRLQVGDTGAGLTDAPPRPGGGVGMANLRERLRSLYGEGARVQLLENQPSGLIVRLLLPHHPQPPSRD